MPPDVSCPCAVINPPESTEPVKEGFEYLLLEFKGHRRVWHPNPGMMKADSGDYLIVEADRGEDAGILRAWRSENTCPQAISQFNVIRLADERDIERIRTLRDNETTVKRQCQSKITKHRLAMKLIDAEYRFDGLKLTFFFTAEGRVDFRELVRDLAGTFRTRIELRQIGARDELKRGDDYGVCGQRLCCASFLEHFQPITTNMAKSQKLILNPIKLSGRCARLKCCLAFEMSNYGNGDAALTGVDLPTLVDPDSKLEIVSD